MKPRHILSTAVMVLLPFHATAQNILSDVEISYGLGVGQSTEAYVGAEDDAQPRPIKFHRALVRTNPACKRERSQARPPKSPARHRAIDPDNPPPAL